MFWHDMLMGTPLWMWAVFAAVVITLLVLDLGVLHRKSHEIGVRESLLTSTFYIAVGLAFGGWVWMQRGSHAGEEYLTGFLIEKSLAMDNIFVMSLVFSYFAIPRLYQHKVLFWGILGVIVMRGAVIAVGSELLHDYAWLLLVFALFLVATGVHMLLSGDKVPDLRESRIYKALQRVLRVTPQLEGDRFFIRAPHPKTGKIVLWCTPLFVALAMIEAIDLVFALDSVPAIFAITTDPYIVYTSNIFAILGLRALYFALAAVIHRFRYMKQALALILVFIGGKVLAADLLGMEKIPASLSLGVTTALLAGGVAYSLYRTSAKAGA